MKLYDLLQRASSEEDVKDIYIRKLFLTNAKRGLVDIESLDVWAEAKKGHNISSYKMFTQLLYYVNTAREDGDKEIPSLLAVFDQQKASLMKTSDVLDFLKKGNIKWGKSASQFTKETEQQVAQLIGTHFREFNLEADGGVAFIQEFVHARLHNEFIRTKITEKNFEKVFKIWMGMVGCEIDNIGDNDRLFFFTDIINDGKVATRSNLPARLLFDGDIPVFEIEDEETNRGITYRLKNLEGYRNFWMEYHRPPDDDYQDNLLERGDRLIQTEERMLKGAYYTPDWVVAKAYDTLAKTLGKNWQKEYFVWDMCCGVGNLEKPHSHHHNVFMSTLDNAEVRLMKSSNVCAGAERFQYNYLNDDITDDGKIEYSPNSAIPQELRDAIQAGEKILVLMNPPYGEGMNAGQGVADTRIAKTMGDVGYASRELYAQFLTRIAKEIPNATIAMFSTLKYINAPNFEKFRANWNAKYLGGFIVHSHAFDGLPGNFPIGFLIWDTNPKAHKNKPIGNITIDAIDKSATPCGTKTFYPIPTSRLINNWIKRPKPNDDDALPLSSALSPTTRTKDVRGLKWSDRAIGTIISKGSDFQNAKSVAILSSTYNSAGGFFITKENLAEVAMLFTMRLVIKATWKNDRDQFLIPTGELTDEFKNDCLIWMLFNDSNGTASADELEWNDTKWRLVNHFIPFRQSEVNPQGNKFKSAFMAEYLEDKKLSPEALAVMAEGRKLWKTFFDTTDPYKIREEYKLDRSDAGWYQIRNALKKRNEKKANPKAYLTDFNESYEILSDKIRPMVFDLGFLPPNH